MLEYFQEDKGEQEGVQPRSGPAWDEREQELALCMKRFVDRMPGGFFVYHADGDEEIIYANEAMLRIFNCDSMTEFRKVTGNSFRGIVHPEDLEEVEKSIWQQIADSSYDLDYVEYRIIAKNGEIRWVEDYGHFIHSETAGGDVFYVFIADATEKRYQQEEEKRSIIRERIQKEQRLQKQIEEYGKELEEANQEQVRRLIVIEGLSSDYVSIFYANLDENWIQPYRIRDKIEYHYGKKSRRYPFEDFDTDYIRTWVHPEDREQLASATNAQSIRQRLAKEKRFHVNYRVVKDGRTEYLQLRFVKVGEEEHVSEVIMGYRSVDEEIMREMEQKGIAESALGHARKENAAKDAFLANMSHDMRTPMNAIVGFTNLAKRYMDDREKLWKYLCKISESSERLLTLINDVLEISQMDTSKDELEEGACNLLESVKSVRESILPRAAAKNIEFSMDVSEVKHCDVYSDPEKLNRILERLGSNAIQYTEDGGRIEISVRELEEIAESRASYQFVVEDNGIGMSESFQSRMFEPFERQQNTTMSGVPGTGLGLTITKRIVEMMGGNIEVDSVEGGGSKFTVTLEFRIRQESQEQEDDREESMLSRYGQKKVLLVEDNELNLELEVELLRDEGFVVETAENGSIAVDMMKNAKPGEYGVVLMDIQMPVMDGYHAALAIRGLSNPELANIPIIAVSANTFDEDRRKAFECGMNAYVAKPVDIPQLLHAIGEAWGIHVGDGGSAL